MTEWVAEAIAVVEADGRTDEQEETALRSSRAPE